jgi:rhodanese-related sulfurtransferase
VTVAQVAEQIRDGGVVLDARSEADAHQGSLPGALPLPWAQVGAAFRGIEPFLLADEPVIVYCSGLVCDEALLLCRFLREQGYAQVYLFAGGVEAWRASGHPLEGGP